MKIDALIAGAGPVGLTLASELARFGLTVRIIDRNTIPQSETERVLEEHCNSLGVRVERRTELTTFTQNADSVTCTINKDPGTEDWQEETLEAAWLIDGTGPQDTEHLLKNLIAIP